MQIIKKKVLWVLIPIIFLCLTPFVVRAQTEYVPLAPIPSYTSDAGCDPSNPTDDACKTTFQKYLPGAFKLAIALAGGLAVIMIMVGGIQYITSESMGGKQDGKERITNAIIGLLLAIGTYVILNTINPKILEFNLDISTEKQTTAITPSTPRTEVSPTGAIVSCTAGKTIPGKTWCDDSAERNELTKQKIKVKDPPCQDIGQASCTSVYGLYITAINSLGSLKTRCDAAGEPCDIIITGGTEYWLHDKNATPECRLDINCNSSGHKPNGTVVDLRIGTAALDAYIKKGGPVRISGCASGTKYIVNGKVFVDETPGGDHWHVCLN